MVITASDAGPLGCALQSAITCPSFLRRGKKSLLATTISFHAALPDTWSMVEALALFK
jgi:hypothetical protein